MQLIREVCGSRTTLFWLENLLQADHRGKLLTEARSYDNIRQYQWPEHSRFSKTLGISRHGISTILVKFQSLPSLQMCRKLWKGNDCLRRWRVWPHVTLAYEQLIKRSCALAFFLFPLPPSNFLWNPPANTCSTPQSAVSHGYVWIKTASSCSSRGH